MASYRDHFLQLTEDGFVTRHSYMDMHLSHGIQGVIGQKCTSSHQLEIETGRFRGVPAKARICQLCHIEKERELHHIRHCPVYYEIQGCFHCLFREGFGPLARVMRDQDYRCLGLFLLELRRHREGLLRRSDSGRHSKREITDFFRPQTRQSNEHASQQTSESTCTRGILNDRAIELGRSRCPRLRASSQHRWRMR